MRAQIESDKLVVYTHPVHGVCVFHPAKDNRAPGEGEIQWLARCIARAVPPEAEDAMIVNASALPPDRRFRNAWVIRDGQVMVDMDMARELHRTRIRRTRQRMLREADVDQLRSLHDPDKLAAVEEHKQALRDLPADPAIDAAQTPDELYAAWPDGMRRPKDFAKMRGSDQPRARAAVLANPQQLPLPANPTKVTPHRPGWLSKVLEKAAADHVDVGSTSVPEVQPLPVELPAEEPEAPDPVVTAVSLAMTLDDGARRKLAQEKVAKAVADWMQVTFMDRPRYELAVQALNDLPFALESFTQEATERGITIQELCREIVIVQQAKQRRMAHVYALNAKALNDINAATGDDIDSTATDAAAAIMGE